MRYSRQYVLPEVGEEGQSKIAQAKILLIGVGGLGSPCALYLAGAGVGCLGLVDADSVSLSNLHRQILYATQDVGKTKLEVASQRLTELNPSLEIRTHPYFAGASNIDELLLPYDIVIDGSDSLATRALVSRAALRHKKPYIYGGIFRFEGQLAVFGPEGQPCYRCLFPELPSAAEVPSCAEAGVLGPLPGIIGSMQALEALKLILGRSQAYGQLFIIDALRLEAQSLKIPRRASCEFCSASAKEKPATDESWELQAEALQLADPRLAPEHAQWIDVRSEAEFQSASLPQAWNIPLPRLKEEAARLSAGKTYIVYCASGIRSREAQALLLRAGYASVWNLQGGLQGLIERQGKIQ